MTHADIRLEMESEVKSNDDVDPAAYQNAI
jgi:hypothetical protein